MMLWKSNSDALLSKISIVVEKCYGSNSLWHKAFLRLWINRNGFKKLDRLYCFNFPTTMPSNSNNDALATIKHQTSPWPPSLRQRCFLKSTILLYLRTQPYQNGGPPRIFRSRVSSAVKSCWGNLSPKGVLVFGPSRPHFWVDLAVIWHGDSFDKRQASLFSYKMSNLHPKLPKMAKNKKRKKRLPASGAIRHR